MAHPAREHADFYVALSPDYVTVKGERAIFQHWRPGGAIPIRRTEVEFVNARANMAVSDRSVKNQLPRPNPVLLRLQFRGIERNLRVLFFQPVYVSGWFPIRIRTKSHGFFATTSSALLPQP